jgi:hypothetical protein
VSPCVCAKRAVNWRGCLAVFPLVSHCAGLTPCAVHDNCASCWCLVPLLTVVPCLPAACLLLLCAGSPSISTTTSPRRRRWV